MSHGLSQGRAFALSHLKDMYQCLETFWVIITWEVAAPGTSWGEARNTDNIVQSTGNVFLHKEMPVLRLRSPGYEHGFCSLSARILWGRKNLFFCSL